MFIIIVVVLTLCESMCLNANVVSGYIALIFIV